MHSLHGYLFSFTETTFINYHDPVTLETIGTFNMREAKTFPTDAFCQTQTAHGHFDDQGSFWNVMGCMRASDSDDHPGQSSRADSSIHRCPQVTGPEQATSGRPDSRRPP